MKKKDVKEVQEIEEIEVDISQFPIRLRELRAAKRDINNKPISQGVFAKTIGVTRSSASLYENGQNKPDVETFKRIAKYYGVTYDYLLGDSNNKSKENIDIGNELGLNDDAIDNLKSIYGTLRIASRDSRDFTFPLEAYNSFLAHKDLQRMIINILDFIKLNLYPTENTEFERALDCISLTTLISGQPMQTISHKRFKQLVMYDAKEYIYEIAKDIISNYEVK